MSRMIELAERCEAATGPDRELDEAIAKMRGWKREGFNLGKGIYDPNGNWHMHAPLFTASLDAAKTLWPGEVPHLIPSDPRICTAMALRARAATQGTDHEQTQEARMEEPERIATDSRRVTEERTRLLRAAVERRLQQRRDNRGQIESLRAREAMSVSEEQIKHMVGRFLGWRLPDNFNPDAGISFEPKVNVGTAYEMRHEPTGTNLLDADQAEAMVRHMVEGMPALTADDGQETPE